MGEIAHRPAKAGAEIGHTRAFRNQRAARQFVGCSKAAVMVLVMRKEIVGGEALDMASTCAQLCKDDVAGDRMPVIKIDCLSFGIRFN